MRYEFNFMDDNPTTEWKDQTLSARSEERVSGVPHRLYINVKMNFFRLTSRYTRERGTGRTKIRTRSGRHAQGIEQFSSSSNIRPSFAGLSSTDGVSNRLTESFL